MVRLFEFPNESIFVFFIAAILVLIMLVIDRNART